MGTSSGTSSNPPTLQVWHPFVTPGFRSISSPNFLGRARAWELAWRHPLVAAHALDRQTVRLRYCATREGGEAD